MLKLITIKQAERQARQDIGELEVEAILPDLEQKVLAASAIVLNYLKIPIPEFTSPSVTADIYNTWSDLGVPHDVQQATLLVLSELWENREASTSDPLSPAVCSLLRRYRDDALA